MGGLGMERIDKGTLESLVQMHVYHPNDCDVNFMLAKKYQEIDHWAGAITHYLKCAEYAECECADLMVYESLLQIAILLGKMGDRKFVEEGYLLHALKFMPERPEAYWLLSRLYEWQKNWQMAYTMACLGIDCCTGLENKEYLVGMVFYKLLFQKAVSAWWVGYCTESRELFFKLPDHPLDEEYIQHVQNNLSSLGSGPDPFLPYTKDKAERLRVKFDGCDKIEKNFSQAYQDMFVLTMLNGKRDGFYLEIGSADPYYGSNTALLEQQFGWEGISVEILDECVKKFKQHRKNPVVCRDAQTINYDVWLRGVTGRRVIDYLQVDCEPPKTTYDILLSLPFETFQFRVITFEHDYYADASRKYRELSRQFLHQQGYLLVAGNISPNDKSPFEDWWVHPDLVDKDILERMWTDDANKIKQAEKYMLGEYENIVNDVKMEYNEQVSNS